MHAICLSAKLSRRDHSGDPGIDGRIILEWILGKYCGRMRTGCIWLGIPISGGLFWTRNRIWVLSRRWRFTWPSVVLQ